MTFSFFFAHSSASSAENTTLPTAAPGEAGRPFDRIFFLALGSIWGWSSWSICSGLTLRTASSFLMSFSFTMSTAICTAAAAVRLPLRVWSIQRLPSWMVNSMSCMSL